MKSISFLCNPAAFDFARDCGLVLGGRSLFVRSGDLPVCRVSGGLYLSVGGIIGRFDLTVRRSEGAPNGYDASKQRQGAVIRTRTAEGRSRAKAQGKAMGRPPSLTPEQQKEATQRRSEGATLKELADSYDRSISTMRRTTRDA